ncbi:glycosyltransferase [Streptacidiphilus sp. PB12-B1b]|uniref:glycosyltransferase n=1 Tax=Streptacidiphilus sp. PB12-B1b TaxID=2705012 RepID=UPI0015FE487F|nr:glycosyltransferase [Streptacidiphilus sp. PB12-B1b]QMU76702.1 glycosyltransferase [Streptacidiphilus sp. PB12-B1b]
MIRAVAVVVPARDEERLIAACLDAVARAAAHPGVHGLPVTVLVVADSCTDRTGPRARAHGARTLAVSTANVGAARALGTAHVLELLGVDGGPVPAEQVWLAHTDADSVVPPCWLAHQLQHAADGFDAVLGTVRVADWSAHTPQTRDRYLRQYHRHVRTFDHPHIHGAHLGVRTDAYLAARGFPALAVGEDRALARALGAQGSRIMRRGSCPVLTSARRQARARGGFGDLLLALEAG